MGGRANLAAGISLRAIAPGWAITALFYSAVHFTRAYLSARHGVQVSSHEEMRAIWNRHPELRQIKADYVHLKQVSEGFRYYLEDFAPEDVDRTRRHAEKIRSFLENKILRAIATDQPT